MHRLPHYCCRAVPLLLSCCVVAAIVPWHCRNVALLLSYYLSHCRTVCLTAVVVLSHCCCRAVTVLLSCCQCCHNAANHFQHLIVVTYCRTYEPKWQELACATVTDKSFWLKNGDWLVTKARKASGGPYSAGTVVEYLRKQGGHSTVLCLCVCVCVAVLALTACSSHCL